jgi:tetratricopeptide (TPR) repeat protein
VRENVTVPRTVKGESKPEPQGKLLALLCLLTLVVYANTFGLGFALDAIGLVKGDPRVHAVTAQNLELIFQNDYWWPSSVDTLYRPLTTLSFLFNYAVLGNGENAAGYHVLNVLLHMVNVLLVFQLAGLLFSERKAAFFAAALWAVHPIVTESVANIAGRADLLATMAVLGGLLLYIRIMTRAGERWRWPVAGLFAVSAGGLFSKESAAVLLGLMLLWDLACGAGWRGAGARRMAAYGAVGCALVLMLAARLVVFNSAPVPEMPFVDNPLRGAGFLAARWTAIKMVGMDLLLLLWPLHLSSERGFDQIAVATAGDPVAWLSFAVVAGILAVVTLRYRRDKLMFWAAGMFGIALLPVSNLVVLIGATMAERFLYLPSIGFAIAVVGLLYRVKARVPLQAILIGLVAVLACRTLARNGDWRDNLTLAQTDVHNAPRSARLQQMLATSLFAEDPVRNLDAAMKASEAAWEILRVLPPGEIYQQTPAWLGAYYRLKGDAVGAPGNREWYEKSAAVLERAREASQAIEKAYDQAQLAHGKPLATRVAYQPVYADLGLAYMRLGRYSEAVDAYRYGREVDPRTPALYDLLADAYAAQGEPRRVAETLLAKTLLLGATAEALGQLARVYGEDSCAIERGSGWMKLNEACPVVQADLCPAERDLAELLRKARLAEVAAQFADRAEKQGCVTGGR